MELGERVDETAQTADRVAAAPHADLQSELPYPVAFEWEPCRYGCRTARSGSETDGNGRGYGAAWRRFFITSCQLTITSTVCERVPVESPATLGRVKTN